MIKNEEQIIKDMSLLEDFVGSIRERSKKCDPNIVYPLEQYQTIVDRLFLRYEDISKGPKYKNRFNILIKDFETYRGEYTSECICHKK